MLQPFRRGLLPLLLLFILSPTGRAFEDREDSTRIRVQSVGPSCATYKPKSIADTNSRKIKIIVTHDVHGRIFENEGQKQIGYALLQGRIDAAISDGFEVYLLDAGDSVSGNAVTQFDSGKSVSEAMGAMGYRVISPGNHEFDFNDAQDNPHYYSELLTIMRDNSAGNFDATCLNLTYKGGDVPGISREPVVLIDESGFRLAVIGVLTPYTRKHHNRKALEGFDFGLVGPDDDPDHAATKQHILDLLSGAVGDFDRPGDVVVVLSHIGLDDSDDYRFGQISGRDLAGVANIDFVADSHSHNVHQAEQIGDVYYGIADRYMTHFSELTIVSKGGELFKHMEVRSYDDVKNSQRPEEVLTMLREMSDRMRLDERLFELDAALTDDGVNKQSVPVGRLLCKAIADLTRADLALINSGGIRGAMMPGMITTGDLYDVFPYQNNIVTIMMTGEEIQKLFDDMKPRKTNAFPQHFGMKVFSWEDGEYALKIAGILDGEGEELRPEKLYRVVLNDFIAYGGDGYEINTDRLEKSHGDMASGLVLYLRDRGNEAANAALENEALLIYPTRGEAEEAYSRALSKAVAQ